MSVQDPANPLLPHILQRDGWMEVQRAMGREVIQRSGDGWSYAAVLETGRVSRRLYCPYGPTVTKPGALKAAMADLKETGKAHKATFVRVEPLGEVSQSDVDALGLVKAERHVQPEDTLVKELVGTEDEILASLSKTVRSNWRGSQRKGVEYRVSTDPSEVRELIRLLNQVAERTGMAPHDAKYFETVTTTLMARGEAVLVLAELESSCIAATLIYYNDSCAYYAHAAADYEYRNLRGATGVVVKAMFFAAEQGCRYFDLFGVAPEGASSDHPWSGFTSFKMTFGGERRHALGTFELPVSKMKYRLYRLALTAAGKVGRR